MKVGRWKWHFWFSCCRKDWTCHWQNSQDRPASARRPRTTTHPTFEKGSSFFVYLFLTAHEIIPPFEIEMGLFPSYPPRCRATLRQMATAQRPQRAHCVLGRFGAGAPRRRAKGLKNMARRKRPKVKGWSSYCWRIHVQPLRYLDIFVAGSQCPQLTHIYPGSSTSGSFSLVRSELLVVFQHVLHSNI